MHIHLNESESRQLVDTLIDWFQKTRRDLPWRRTYDPYHVRISEIMLQQTQMERGVRYFLSWMARFPTVAHVADATEDEILQQWEGLGYYRRARNLHKAAQIIVDSCHGIVPEDYDSLLSLPGIGPYTAAAVASIAGNNDVAVVDANVNRVFARIFDIEEPIKRSSSQRRVRSIAEKLLPPGKARKYNQALMDFGGLICTPKLVRCEACPVKNYCRALQRGLVEERPVLEKTKERVFVYRVAAVMVHEGKIFVQKRDASSVWGGLWELPGGESIVEKGGGGDLDIEAEVAKNTDLCVQRDDFLVRVNYQYTHHKVTLDCYLCRVHDKGTARTSGTGATCRWVFPLELEALPCPSGIRKVITYLKETRPLWFEENLAKL